MRITTRMMTNNMLSNINKNKINMSKLEEQYSTGKKIQRPSDDPIIAVRALKLRTSITELDQYYEKIFPMRNPGWM
jgi:Flagellin and related hook-associated proteins